MWQLIFTWKLKIKYIARSVLCPAPVPAKPDIAAIFHILSRRLQLVDSQQSARKSNNSLQIFLIFYLKSEVRISEMWTILNNINTVQYWLFTVEKEKNTVLFSSVLAMGLCRRSNSGSLTEPALKAWGCLSLLSLTGSFWVQLYWRFLGLTVLGLTWPYWALLGLTGLYWALLDPIGPYFAYWATPPQAFYAFGGQFWGNF